MQILYGILVRYYTPQRYRKVKTPGIERELRGRTSPGPGVYQENFGKNLPQFTCADAAILAKGSRTAAMAH